MVPWWSEFDIVRKRDRNMVVLCAGVQCEADEGRTRSRLHHCWWHQQCWLLLCQRCLVWTRQITWWDSHRRPPCSGEWHVFFTL